MKETTIKKASQITGAQGGKKTVSKYGRGHMSELGKKSAARRKELREKAAKQQ